MSMWRDMALDAGARGAEVEEMAARLEQDAQRQQAEADTARRDEEAGYAGMPSNAPPEVVNALLGDWKDEPTYGRDYVFRVQQVTRGGEWVNGMLIDQDGNGYPHGSSVTALRKFYVKEQA